MQWWWGGGPKKEDQIRKATKIIRVVVSFEPNNKRRAPRSKFTGLVSRERVVLKKKGQSPNHI